MVYKQKSERSCLIIGGGISGLIAADILKKNGKKVTIIDKGRGIGGRLATRRIRPSEQITGVFDYGMQFFAVSDPFFQQWVDQWLLEGVIVEWSNELIDTQTPCYRGTKSNRSLAQYLAQDLDVHLQTRAIAIKHHDSGWRVETETGEYFEGDSLILTVPVPQSLTLLKNSGVSLPSSVKSRLEGVTYYPCVTILALLEELSLIPSPGWLTPSNSPVAAITCNQKKGISPQGCAVTIHCTPECSQTYWDTDDAVIAEKLFNAASHWLGSTVMDYQVHRWRYSHPKTVYGEEFLSLENPGLLIQAGDAFCSKPVPHLHLTLEKAVLSGIKAAHYLLNY
ncbi:MAG: NAD(P)/FAD-dependent oxidoreductase [Crocosphaera sp.]